LIAYFDTSAVIPLLLGEPSSAVCTRIWNDADRCLSVRLLYPEARAALARARRMHRVTPRQLTAAVRSLDLLMTEIEHVEIRDGLARHAGDLAQTHDLRGFDAVHLAAALAVADAEVVFVSGDADLTRAASRSGLAVAITS